MAEGLLGGVLGGDDEKPASETPEALAGVETTAGAEAFAAAIAANAARHDAEVARDASVFLRRQAQLLEIQAEHLKDEHALRLAHLAHQRHLLLGQRLGQAIRLSFQVVIALVVIVIGIGIAVMLRDAFTSHSVVIDAFNAPAALAARGVTGTVLAGDVLDELTHLQNAARTFNPGFRRNLSNGWSSEVKVAVPETGISLGEISRLLTARFGHDIHIGGDLIETDSGGLALTVRGDNVSPRTFTGSAGELDALVASAAQYLYSQFQPVLWAQYLLWNGRCPEAIDFVKSIYYGGADAQSRAALLDEWALCARPARPASGSWQEGARLLQAAIAIQPDYWDAYTELQYMQMYNGEEEAAWRTGQTLRHAAGGEPGAADPRYFAASNTLTKDLQAIVSVDTADLQVNGGSGTLFTGDLWEMAQTEALLHDPVAAALTLQTARPDDRDPVAVAGLHLSRGLLAADAGDSMGAATELDTADAALSDARVAHLLGSYVSLRCQLAVAEDAAGHPDKADAVIASGSHYVDCQRFRGDILDHRGDWAGAQQAYAQAVALAPDLPAAYYSWGVALARHGDLAGALAKLQAANQRGPHWADPLKAWGDVLTQQGHWSDALAKYDEALKYAPNWAALTQARDAAARKSS